MKYKLINRTKIPRDVLETLIEFAAPKGIKKVTISVMYDKGDAAWHGTTIRAFGNKKKLIRIWINKDELEFPRFSNSRVAAKEGGYQPIFLLSDIYEVLLALFAHELRHVWQGSVSKQNFLKSKLCRYKDWDGKEVTSIFKMEKDACQYAKKTLQRYKKL